jgi:glycerophosphoryl diester phosphodiesterase
MKTDLSWLVARPIAHRGFHDLNRQRWENTLPAFAAAVERGYAIECDVQLTSDGVPIIFHDLGLERLAGTAGLVRQRTAREMAALRIGRTDDYPPKLKEMLDLVRGRVPLVVELKGMPGYDEELVSRVCAMLKAYEGPVAMMSFDHWLIRQFPANAGNLPTGLTAGGSQDHELEAHFSMLAHGISFVSYAVYDMPNRFVSFVRERLGMPVISWTIRDWQGVQKSLSTADQMTFEGFEPEAVPIA